MLAHQDFLAGHIIIPRGMGSPQRANEAFAMHQSTAAKRRSGSFTTHAAGRAYRVVAAFAASAATVVVAAITVT
jgi:hypothetical protein